MIMIYLLLRYSSSPNITSRPSNPPPHTLIHPPQGIFARLDLEPLAVFLPTLRTRTQVSHAQICELDVDQAFDTVDVPDFPPRRRTQ